jgi:hypothetical protein
MSYSISLHLTPDGNRLGWVPSFGESDVGVLTVWHRCSWSELAQKHALAYHALETHIIDRLGSSAAGPIIAHNMCRDVTNKSQADQGGHT